MCVCVGITQDRIDEFRGVKEAAMLADIQALVQSGGDLNARDDNGATLVRQGHVVHEKKSTLTLFIKSGSC